MYHCGFIECNTQSDHTQTWAEDVRASWVAVVDVSHADFAVVSYHPSRNQHQPVDVYIVPATGNTSNLFTEFLLVWLHFFHHGFLTIGISTSESCRSGLHNGMWCYKLLILCLICAGIFLIPAQYVNNFRTIWMYFSMVGAGVFIIIQLMLIVDFAHAWTDNWLQRVSNGGSRCWFVAMVFCAMIIYTAIVIGIVLIAQNYTRAEGCSTNKIFIGVNGGLCLLCSFISIMPSVERSTGDSRAGLLQSSVISAYVVYLTWSALSSEPTLAGTGVGTQQERILPEDEEFCSPSDVSFLANKDIICYGGVGITFLMVISSTLRTSHFHINSASELLIPLIAVLAVIKVLEEVSHKLEY
ncbi:serine incorporator 5 [Caerostris extrusa]|uniref:Serine incorporator 5 n=1 Tax=Caerostris extrusa TaxID=172846 RepID=A0AAV4P2C4_CAEEX|nr:serine incorporator 5 [Caerostris extrusa]